MTIRDIVVALGFRIDRNSERDTENRIKGIKNLATKLLGVIGIGFSIAGISNLAETAAEAEALKSQFSQVFGEMEQEAASKLEAIEADTGVLVNRMKGSFTQIAAFSKTAGVEQADALALANRSMIAVADSAAFYDRSIEEVTNSLQSFLKGNFENDAALGLSCTETTRNIAANNLYGKSFKDLSEAEKQFTLLSMVEEANKASGALGQAARESDTWTNQLGNLKQSLTDLKAAVGSTFLKPAVMVLKVLNSLVQKVTTAVEGLTRENGFLTRVTERYHALVKRLQPAIERMIQTFSKGLKKGISVVKGVVEQLGGMETMWRALAVTAGAFFLVMNWKKMLSGAQLLIKLLLGIGKMFSFAHLKILAIVTLVAVLALAIEDFVHFLMGHDSILGTIFDKMGIGADRVRQVIFRVFGKIKDFLLYIWDFLKRSAELWVNTIKGFFEKHGDSIWEVFKRTWGIIQTFLKGVWVFLSQLVTQLFGSTEDRIDDSTQGTKENLLATWKAIVNALSTIWNVLYKIVGTIFYAIASIVNTVFHIIASIIETVFGWIQLFWSNWGSKILIWFQGLWDSIGNILKAFLTVVEGVANFLTSVFTGNWQGAWNAICQIFIGVWNGITAFLNGGWETIQLLFQMGLSAIKSIWEMVWNGIKLFFFGILNWIENKTGLSMEGVKAVFRNALVFIQTIFSTIFGNVKAIVSGVFAVIQSVIRNAMTIVKSVIQIISSAIKGDWFGVWDGMKNLVSAVWNHIKTSIMVIFQTIKSMIFNTLSAIQKIFQSIWDMIASVVITTVENLKTIITVGLTFILKIWSAVWNGMVDFIHSIWENIKTLFSAALTLLQTIWETMWGTISSVFVGIWNGMVAFLSGIWNTILGVISDAISGAYRVIVSVLSAIWDFFCHIFGMIADFVSNLFQTMLSGITNTISMIKDTIINGLTTAIDWIKELPSQALQWGADIIQGIANGITGAISKVTDAVSGVAGKIKSFLHFSVPDEGPLTDYESWMPDFMNGLAEGIRSQESVVLNPIRELAEGITMLTQAATVKAATAATSTVNHQSSSVTQNVNISNRYSGGTMEAQKNVSKAMKQSAEDATSYMARGLAYARG